MNHGTHAPLSWPALLLLALVSWTAAATLPFGARLLQLRLLVPGKIPAYPGAVFQTRALIKEQTIHILFHAVEQEPLRVEVVYEPGSQLGI